MSRTATTFILLALSSMLSAAEPLQLMQNLDGDLSFLGDTPQDSQQKLEQLVDAIAKGPAKTLMWSIGAGSDILYYQTKVASTWGWRRTKYNDDPKWKTRIERCQKATEAGLDAPRIVGIRARERGLRFYPSYRMNDAHYCSDPLEYPLTGKFWMEHQDATIGSTPVPGAEVYQHLLNYARENVRAYRLGVILEAMDRYADVMEGFELDFNRFQIFFPPGTAEQNAHHLTDLLSKARQHLNAIASEQKRPLKLIVRVPPALKNCTWAGLDISTWINQHLVDAIIPAQVMTLSHDMPIDEFVKLAQPAGIEVIGSLYGRAAYHWPFSPENTTEAYAKEVTRTPGAPQFLGAALNQRHLGASGHQIYNYILHANPDVCAALTTQQGLRRYQVTTAYFHDKTDTYEYRKQLPAPLKTGEETALRVLIGEAPAQSTAQLRLGLHGANQDYSAVALTVRINGELLATPTPPVVTKGPRHGIAPSPATEAYAQWPVPITMLRQGWNNVGITVTNSPKPLQLVETEFALTPPPP